MKFRRRRDRGSLQIAVCVRGYLVGDLKCCLRDKAGVMLNCKLPPGIYAVEQCKSCVDAGRGTPLARERPPQEIRLTNLCSTGLYQRPQKKSMMTACSLICSFMVF